MLRFLLVLAAVIATGIVTGAAAQDYPTRPVSLIVPFTAGGPTDTLARNLAQQMTKVLKQQVIVENRPGAGGTLAPSLIAKSKPDGYQVLIAHIGMSTAPALYRKLPFNPLTDFEYIGQVADVPMTLIARTGLPPDNYKDFVAYVKANKDKLNMGNAGLGAASHLCGLLFMSRIQADIQTIPYQGTAPAMSALMGNQIDLMCDQTTNTTGPILSGRVKVFGVTSKKRVPSLQFVPTAILSRQLAGIRGQSLIINLPGKPTAIAQCLEAVFPAVPYCIDLIGGPFLTTDEAFIKAFRPKQK